MPAKEQAKELITGLIQNYKKLEQEGRLKEFNEANKKNRVFHSTNIINNTYAKYLDGRDVGRYKLGWSGEYLSYGDWLAEPRKSVPFKGPRILVRQIPSPLPYAINAVYTEEYLLNDINSMVVYDFKDDPFFLLASLNSRVTSFWFANTFDKFQRKTFPQFKVKELALFPIPQAKKGDKSSLARMAKQMLDLNKQLQSTPENINKWQKLKEEIEQLDRKIDEEVYRLYGLTEEEIKVVEETTHGN